MSSPSFTSIDFTSDIITITGSGFSSFSGYNMNLSYRGQSTGFSPFNSSATIVNDTTITSPLSYKSTMPTDTYSMTLFYKGLGYDNKFPTGLTIDVTHGTIVDPTITSVTPNTGLLNQTIDGQVFPVYTNVTFTGTNLDTIKMNMHGIGIHIQNLVIVNSTTATATLVASGPQINKNLTTVTSNIIVNNRGITGKLPVVSIDSGVSFTFTN